MTRANARAFVTSIIRQGVFGQQRWSYWKFLIDSGYPLSPLRWRSHDPGRHGLSLPGNDQQIVRELEGL